MQHVCYQALPLCNAIMEAGVDDHIAGRLLRFAARQRWRVALAKISATRVVLAAVREKRRIEGCAEGATLR